MFQNIDLKSNQLTFIDGRYYRTDVGGYVPSVTTILEAYPKPYQLLQWLKEQGENADTVLKAAGRRGTNVHHLTELYDAGCEAHLLDANGNPQYSLQEWQMFERYVNFSERMKPQHHIIEQNYVSEVLGFAGTIDRISTVMGKNYIIDIKTSNGIYDTYWLQLAAYRQLYTIMAATSAMPIHGVAILWLNAKTRTEKEGQGVGWQLVTKHTGIDEDWKLFRSVQDIWQSINADAKPKNFTYKLKHKKHD